MRTNLHVLTATAVAVLLTLVPGCKFNQTIVRLAIGGGLALRTYVTVQTSAATREELQAQVERWYKDKEPTIEPAVSVDGVFRLCFEFSAEIGLGDKEHFGVECKRGFPTWRILKTEQASETDIGEIASAPEVTLGTDRALGRMLKVTNPSEAAELRINDLEVALAWTDLPLDSLNYANPVVESLPWTSVIESPTYLLAGETITIDIADDPIAGRNCFARVLFSDVGDPEAVMDVVSEIPGSGALKPVGALSRAGLVFLGVSLAAVAVVTVVRRRDSSTRTT